MGEYVARIEKLENGYEVEVCDPAVDKANKNPKTPWKDPWKHYAFSTSKEVIAFLTKVLDDLKPPKDDMATNFQRATEDD